MSQTRDQQRFTVSEVGADWHAVGPMVGLADKPSPQSATLGLQPVATISHVPLRVGG